MAAWLTESKAFLTSNTAMHRLLLFLHAQRRTESSIKTLAATPSNPLLNPFCSGTCSTMRSSLPARIRCKCRTITEDTEIGRKSQGPPGSTTFGIMVTLALSNSRRTVPSRSKRSRMTALTLQVRALQTVGSTLSSPAADRPAGHSDTASTLETGSQTRTPAGTGEPTTLSTSHAEGGGLEDRCPIREHVLDRVRTDPDSTTSAAHCTCFYESHHPAAYTDPPMLKRAQPGCLSG